MSAPEVAEIGGVEFTIEPVDTVRDIHREIDQRYASLDPRDKIVVAEILEHQAKIIRALADAELAGFEAVAR